MRAAALVVLFVILAGIGVSCEISVWSECRAGGHSWLYCSRLLSK